jgi:hypothetical protein
MHVVFTFATMQQYFKIVVITFVFLFFASTLDSCRRRGPYNPYLHMKVKPNKLQMDADKKAIKRGDKAYARQLGRNRRHLFGLRKAPAAAPKK